MRRECFPLFGQAGLFIVMAAIGGCGDSTPETGNGSAAPASITATPDSAPAAAVLPGKGIFMPIPPDKFPANARVDSACNVDSIDGRPAANSDLQRASSPVFAGWISDSATGSVPPGVVIVLKGRRDFAVTASTGVLRADVAKARNQPSLLHSGYMVKADLVQVPAGKYSMVLLSTTAGRGAICDTHKQVSVHENEAR